MAASLSNLTRFVFRLSSTVCSPLRQVQRLPVRRLGPGRCLCVAASLKEEQAVRALEARHRYKEKPWEYLESEGTAAAAGSQVRLHRNQYIPFHCGSPSSTEYLERYGNGPVWAGYRRNHKGGIPPQKTRRTCIRGDKVCGNPCPVCRDSNLIVHPQNVKLLQQFMSPHTGAVYDPTRTGVCMKQQKKLNEAINTAQDQGTLPFQIPHVEFSGDDYSNSHDAVGFTPPPPCLNSGETWYKWYGEMTPDAGEVAKVRKLYKAYLKS